MTPKAYAVVFLVPHTRPTHRLTSVELPAQWSSLPKHVSAADSAKALTEKLCYL